VLSGSGANSVGAVAQPSSANLYLLHNGVVQFIATLDQERDRLVWQSGVEGVGPRTRVSPSGRYLLFPSSQPLTGFDNSPAKPTDCLDSKGGTVVSVPCRELFLFDAESMQLTCVSCDPSGARPVGETIVPGPNAFSEKALGRPAYFPRQVHDDGRVFFTTQNPLNPADVNDASDVYEYYDGQLRMIGTGTAPGGSVFLDTSSGGADVYFTTLESLVASDADNAMSVYDARIGGGFPEPLFPPPPCEGEGCRGQASSPGEALTPGSLNFSGPQAGPNHVRKTRCRRGFVMRKGRCYKKAPRKARKHKKSGKAHSRRIVLTAKQGSAK
jgi:hypothetical protein